MKGITLKLHIRSIFKSEAECARMLGWSRQKLNKITKGKQLPDITELNALACVLKIDANDLIPIFLEDESTNGQQSA